MLIFQAAVAYHRSAPDLEKALVAGCKFLSTWSKVGRRFSIKWEPGGKGKQKRLSAIQLSCAQVNSVFTREALANGNLRQFVCALLPEGEHEREGHGLVAREEYMLFFEHYIDGVELMTQHAQYTRVNGVFCGEPEEFQKHMDKRQVHALSSFGGRRQ
jgi:hypothetical protein